LQKPAAFSRAGQVLPSTLHNISLVADVKLPTKMLKCASKGKARSQKLETHRRLWIEPGNPAAFPPTLQAILSADMIVIGPGSIYTSLVPIFWCQICTGFASQRGYKFYIVTWQPNRAKQMIFM
jgi:2-phospho-L-lactate transferase/gluconeogenesis factor (CofD/UPF0052 family)